MDTPGPLKRKREEKGEHDWHDSHGGFMDDDSEPHRFGTSALPVANLPLSFDGVPQDGLEYLFTVRREEKQLPLVTRVHNPYSVKTTKDMSGPNSTPGFSSILPSEEWRVCFEERFRNLRANIRQPTIHVTLPDSVKSEAVKIPEMRERDRWWAFFRGDIDWIKIPSSQFHTKKHETTNTKKDTIEYDRELPTQRGKMRGWVVYDEQLSWDQSDGGGVAEPLPDGRKGGDANDTNGTEEDKGGPEQEDLSESQGSLRRGSHDEVIAETALPTPRGSPDPPAVGKATAPVVIGPREPTPELIAHLDQKVTFHLLKYFTQWIQGHFDRSVLPAPPPLPGSYSHSHSHDTRLYDLMPTHARWMFALLSRLDAQLTSDEISVLRKLAREVIRVINEEKLAKKASGSSSSMAKSSMGETGCWMIVAAIVSVWGQKDLWMDAEESLR